MMDGGFCPKYRLTKLLHVILISRVVARLENKTTQEGASRQGGLGACPPKKV